MAVSAIKCFVNVPPSTHPMVLHCTLSRDVVSSCSLQWYMHMSVFRTASSSHVHGKTYIAKKDISSCHLMSFAAVRVTAAMQFTQLICLKSHESLNRFNFYVSWSTTSLTCVGFSVQRQWSRVDESDGRWCNMYQLSQLYQTSKVYYRAPISFFQVSQSEFINTSSLQLKCRCKCKGRSCCIYLGFSPWYCWSSSFHIPVVIRIIWFHKKLS